MKKLGEYEYVIIIIIGLVKVVLDYIDAVSPIDSIGLVFMVIGLIIMFGEYIWKNKPIPCTNLIFLNFVNCDYEKVTKTIF